MSAFELQKLVHALDKSEKKRFREFAELDKHYSSLFDDLNDSPPLTDTEFKTRFKDRDYIKNYSYNKGYLLTKLLDAMRMQKQKGGLNKPPDFQVPELIDDARFLFQKMFYQLCSKRLSKAEKLAKEFELHEELLKILRFQGRLVIAEQAPGYRERANEIYTETLAIAQVILTKFQYLKLRNELFLSARTSNHQRNESVQEGLTEIMAHPLMQDISQATSFDAQLNFHFSHAIFQQITWNLKHAFFHHQKIFQLWKRHSHFRETRSTDFRNSLNNYLLVASSVKNYEDFVDGIGLLESGPFRSKDERAESRQNALYIRLQNFIALCKWEDANAIEKDFGKELELIGQKLIPSRTMSFYLSFAQLNLITGDYVKASRWNRRILDLGNHPVRRDLRLYALLLSLILLYESGEWGDLGNRFRATMRAYKKETATLGFEKRVSEFLRQLPGFEDKSLLSKGFARLRDQLMDLKGKPEEWHAQGFQFILAWLQSKIEQRSLKEALELGLG